MDILIKDIIGSDEYVIGKQWLQVPFIRHDILRSDIWIYNRSYTGMEIIMDKTYNFFKHTELPDKDEERSVEWKTIDLLNNIEIFMLLFISKYCYGSNERYLQKKN
jgi:hypothetical protein